MWRKYADIFFKHMQNNFFVGIADMDLSPEDLATIREQLDSYNREIRPNFTPRTFGIQLMENIVAEILYEITLNLEMIKEYAPEKRDDFLIGEFEKLSVAERHFLIMWIYQGFTASDSFRYRVDHGAFRDFHLIKAPPPPPQSE